MTTIGIIGAGNIGGNVAAAAANAGYDVIVSNSHRPESLSTLVSRIGPRARAATVSESARDSDFAIVAIPVAGFDALPEEQLAGKVVMTTTNYIAEYNGPMAELDDGSITEAELLQRRLPASRVVKVFSHLNAAEVPTDGTPAGSPNRRALAIAGNDAGAKQLARTLYDDIGYDALDLGGLEESWRVGFGQPAWIVRQNIDELTANVARAQR